MNIKHRITLLFTVVLLACLMVVSLASCDGFNVNVNTGNPPESVPNLTTDAQPETQPVTNPTETETLAGTEPSVDTEIPVDTDVPVDTDDPADTAVPVPPETLPETETEAESVTPPETETEAESVTPPETVKPDDPADPNAPVEDVAYKFYMTQVTVGKTLYLNGETQNDKFLVATTDPAAALDFYAEKVDGGYKFFAKVGDAKVYLHAATETSADGKVSKFLYYTAESNVVYTYKADTNAWYTIIDGAEYVIGTYGSYETASLSNSSYMTPESTGVSQFPLILIKSADVEAGETPEAPETEAPKPEVPAGDKTIPAFNEIAAAQPDKGATTTAKYTVTGTITEIKNTQYGNMYITDAEGNQLYIYGIYSADGTDRFDAMDPQPKVGDTITVTGVACNYNGPQMKNGWVLELIPAIPDGPVVWNEKKDVVTHQSFDELRHNNGGLFAPGQAAAWNGVAQVGTDITYLQYWGWIGIKGEIGTFGYQIDDMDAVYDAGFTHATEQGVLDVAAGTGADTASRMLIHMDISELLGNHTITVLYRNAAGAEIILNVFTLARTAPVVDENPDLPATEAYKFFMAQVNVEKILYLTGETQNNKFLVTTTDPKAGLDFYAEKVEGGYKFHTTIDGTKYYLDASTETSADGKVSKFLNYTESSDSVFYYKAATNAWFVTIGGAEYVIGTYGTWETASLSDAAYMTPESTGVTQFPLVLIKKADAEALPPVDPEEPEEPSVFDVTIPAFNEIAAAQPDKGETTTDKYTVTGTITEIKNTQYGNMYITDAEGNQLYIYGIYSADGTVRFDAMDPQPKVGDTITVVGVACNYNGPQMKNGWVTELVAGEAPEIPDTPDVPEIPEEPEEPSVFDVTIPAFNEIAAAQPDKGETTTDKYTVTGTITEIANSQYGNMYITDADGNQLYIYGIYSADGTVRFDAMDPQPKVGDTITVVGVACNYNGPQMKNGWVTELVAGEAPEIPDTPDVPEIPEEPEEPSVFDVTIPAFNEIAAAQPDKGETTTDKYTVTGTITEIANSQYGNMYITDADGNQLYIYGIYSADGIDRFDAMDPQPKVGDTITVVGVACNYNGPQMKNGWVTELVAGEAPEIPDTPDVPEIPEEPEEPSVFDVTIPAFNEIAAAQPDKGETTTDKYTVTGTITEIANSQYGNMYITDAEGNQLYIYGIYSADGTVRFDAMDPQPKVGDTITVVGVACNYNGPQMKNGWVTELVAGEAPEIPDTPDVPEIPEEPVKQLTISEFNQIASAQPDKGETTTDKYTVTGTITEIANSQYGNMYITDTDGNQLYIYGIYSADGTVRFDAMDPQPKVGDTITVVGVACNYNGPQMKNGWVTELVVGETPETPDTPDVPEIPEEPVKQLTISEFNKIASAQPDKGETTTDKYTVTGTITEIANSQYGNMYITDADGNQLYIYGIYSADGTVRFDAMDPQPKVGDTITVTGVACNYNGPQMKNGWVTELVAGEAPEIPDTPDVPEIPEEPEEPSVFDVTIPAFNEIAAAQPDKGETTTDKYTVTGTITEIANSQYGNMYITDADGNQLYIYGIYSADGTVRFDAMDPQPKVGDTITVVGVACNYNGPQMKNGWVTELVAGEAPEIPDTPDVPDDSSVSIDFTDLANRTVGTTEQQVWVMNGITVTNNKAAATSDVNLQYYAPIRCYKGSDLEIAYAGMKKIVITCSAASYAKVLSTTAAGVGTVTLDGQLVTIVFDASIDHLIITELSGQVRIDQIQVYTA